MEAIKHSRIIVVLLILYIGISIIVVTLDNSQKKKTKDNSNTSDKADNKYDEYISEVSDLTNEVLAYYKEREITNDICIPLSYVMGDEYSGSAYVSAEGSSIKMWYSNGTYAINNIETLQEELSKDSIEDNYTTSFYNNCGLSE